jgi:O-antigen/teichoic acid export membrane protein
MVGVTALTGMGQALQISSAKQYDGNFIPICFRKALFSFIGSLILLGFAYYYREQIDICYALGLLALVFPLIQFHSVFQPWLNGKKSFNLLVASQISFAIIPLLSLLSLLALAKTDLLSIVFTTSILKILLICGFGFFVLKGLKNSIKNSETIVYGYHTTTAMLFGWMIATDKLFLENNGTIEDVAVYSVALLFPNQIKALYSVINQMIIPQITGASSVREAWAYLKPRYLKIILLFSCIGIIGFFAFPIVIPFLFSDKYVEAVQYAKWLWLVLSIQAPCTYLGNILRYQKKKACIYIFEISIPVVMIILYFFLSQYGIFGIVVSKIFCNIFAAVLYITSFGYYIIINK